MGEGKVKGKEKRERESNATWAVLVGNR